MHLHLTAGNRANITQVRQCLEPYVVKGCTVIPDHGYDANHLRDWLNEAKATACIPSRRNRKVQFEYDVELYKSRNIIERMFNRLKDWRQLSLRTFRCPETFLAAAPHRSDSHLVLMSLRPSCGTSTGCSGPSLIG